MTALYRCSMMLSSTSTGPATLSVGRSDEQRVQSEGKVSSIRWTRGVKHQVDFYMRSQPGS